MTLPPFADLPHGWVFDEHATTAPRGYKLANNGKSRFSPDYEQALIYVADKEENAHGE